MSQIVTPPYYYDAESRQVRKDIGDIAYPVAQVCNWSDDTDPAGQFIVTACNEHATLKADKIALQVEVNRLKMDMDIVRSSLEAADQAMQNAADVQAQLVEALQRAINEAVADDLDDWFSNARAALSAARAAP
jgi:hypothetical protein